MVQTNSWGRKIKDVISVTFKKDEADIKAFLNEQPSPADYIKMLVIKDMKNINFYIPPQVSSLSEEHKEVKLTEESIEENNLSQMSDEAKNKLFKFMDDGE